MKTKPKAPPPPPKRQPQPASPAVVPQPDARWQRTQRYGWDKGGSRGGRR